MKIHEILAEIGRERGIPISDDGNFLVGRIGDFPVCITAGPYQSTKAVYLTFRVGTGDLKALKKDVKKIKGMKSSMLRRGEKGSVQYILPYFLYLGSVKAGVTAALDRLIPLLQHHYEAPPKACEVCGRPDVGDIVIEDGVPSAICTACREELRVKREAARMAYEAINPEHLRGLVFGLVGAAIGAVCWTAIILMFKSVYLILSALIGVGVAFFVKKGMKRVDKAGYVITAVLVLGSIFAGEILASVWLIKRATGTLNVNLAFHSYMNILLNNPRTLAVTVLFALVGAWIGVSALSGMEKDTKIDKIA